MADFVYPDIHNRRGIKIDIQVIWYAIQWCNSDSPAVVCGFLDIDQDHPETYRRVKETLKYLDTNV